MLGGTTRVLVTHQTHVLPQCDAILVMAGGRVKAFYNSYEEMQRTFRMSGR